MRTLKFLTILSRVAFGGMMLCLFFLVPFFLIILSFFPERVPFEIHGVIAEDFDMTDYISLGTQIVGFGFYTYATRLFGDTLVYFSKNQLFRERVIRLLRQTGKFILIGFGLTYASQFVYKDMAVELFTEFISGDIFTVILGLFFFVLAEVFSAAKALEEENDLTV